MSEKFTKSMSRNIFYGGAVFFFLLFVVLTVDTTNALPERDHRENITEYCVHFRLLIRNAVELTVGRVVPR